MTRSFSVMLALLAFTAPVAIRIDDDAAKSP